jgi:hypothetical protein
MAKKVKKRKNKPTLADDLRASLHGLRDFIAGKKTGVVVHRVIANASDARAARRRLGIESKPKAVRRALKSKAS